MNLAVKQPLMPAVSDRLRRRLDTLGAALLIVDANGRISLLGECSWLERQLMTSPPFIAEVRRQFPHLQEADGQVVEIWPELWLSPLALSGRRERKQGLATLQPVTVVMWIGPGFLDSDQFRLLCSAASLDEESTLARVDQTRLVNLTQAQRITNLLTWMHQDDQDLNRRLGDVQNLSQQLGESYEELSLLYKFSTSMTIDQPPAQFLTEACIGLQQVVGLKWMALQLVDDEPGLGELAGEVFSAGPIDCEPDMLKRIGRLIMAKQPPGGGPMVVDDTRRLQIPHLNRIAGRLLVVSLMREERLLGILYGGDKLDGSHISSIDSKLCNSLASSLSMFLENILLYEGTQAMFMGTLHALTSAIDAKDSYTHGHSERVAMLSRQLAVAAGLDPHTVGRLYLAGLVHDLGKIGVPEQVLCKPGQLTQEEFAQIKMHPEIGARILQDIRQMQDLIPGVLYHHERWDGRGYPSGKAGLDIPLFGRLICLADSFDAMSSNRTYRPLMNHERVLGEIRRCAGSQFDPQLAEVFLTMDFGPFLELVQRHQSEAPSPTTSGTRLGIQESVR